MNKHGHNRKIESLVTASIVIDAILALIGLVLIISLLGLGQDPRLTIYYIAGFVIVVLSITSLINLFSKNYAIGTTAMIIAGVASIPLGIIPIIMGIALRKRIRYNKEHKFLALKDLALRAESEGHIGQAIDYYQESIFHLENDYKNLKDKTLEEGRLKHIKFLKDKIELLNSTKFNISNPV